MHFRNSHVPRTRTIGFDDSAAPVGFQKSSKIADFRTELYAQRYFFVKYKREMTAFVVAHILSHSHILLSLEFNKSSTAKKQVDF